MPSPYKERPILFSAPMVRALLDGRKTQTRRVVKPEPHQYVREFMLLDTLAEFKPVVGGPSNLFELPEMAKGSPTIKCPYGKPGDRLWVRENYRIEKFTELMGADDYSMNVRYPADGADRVIYQCDAPDDVGFWPGAKIRQYEGKNRPNIFMYRWLSRIALELTDVRVQRLQDISGEDSETEGVFNHIAEHSVAKVFRAAREFMAIQYYRELWESINGAGSWDANLWVWALTFKVIHA